MSLVNGLTRNVKGCAALENKTLKYNKPII